jgi:hypothetical protein
VLHWFSAHITHTGNADGLNAAQRIPSELLQYPPVEGQGLTTQEVRAFGHIINVVAFVMWVTDKVSVKGVTPGQVEAAVRELSNGVIGVVVPTAVELKRHLGHLSSQGKVESASFSEMTWHIGGSLDEEVAKSFLGNGGPLEAKRRPVARAGAAAEAEQQMDLEPRNSLVQQLQDLPPGLLPSSYLEQLQQEVLDADSERVLQLLLQFNPYAHILSTCLAPISTCRIHSCAQTLYYKDVRACCISCA